MSSDLECGPWFGTVPPGWRCLRLKYAVDLVVDKLESSERDVPYVGLENIQSWTGTLVPGQAEATEGPANRFVKGDVLFGKLRPYLAKILHAQFDGACSGEALVLRPRHVLAAYLKHLLLSPAFIFAVDASTYGAKMPRANWSFIGNMPIPIPPIQEQRAIADFLDHKTAKIDELTAKKKRMNELLREKRLTFVARTTTRGLNPSAQLKSSGVEPLGDIPAHWGLYRSKTLLYEVDERTDDGREELLTVSHITGVTPRAEKPDVTMFMAESLEGYKRCKKNDLVINTMWAWMGALAVSDYDGLVSPSYNVYRLKSGIVPKYLSHLLRTPQYITEITRWSKGVWTSRLRLYPDEFFQIRIPVPPLEEQAQIVEQIEAETGQYEKAITALNRSCDQLADYRAALITAAVTSKTSVTKVAQEEPRKHSANVFFKRAVLAAEILQQLHQQPELGQVKLQKAIHLCEHHAQLSEVEGSYLRDAAGPHDNRMMRSIEARLAEANWFRAIKRPDGIGTEYVPLAEVGQHVRYFESYWSAKKNTIQAVIDLLRPMKTQQAEIVATLYAAWNDLILGGGAVTDEAILREVLTRWHEQKTKIPQERWLSALEWMRKKSLVPTGFGKPTRIRTT